jgi:predicted nucleotide-binding protein
MEKNKTYWRVKFDAKTLVAAKKQLESFAEKFRHPTLQTKVGDVIWSFDTFDEFLAAIDQQEHPNVFVHLTGSVAGNEKSGEVSLTSNSLFESANTVTVRAPTREVIESIFAVFDNNVETCRLPEASKPVEPPKIFIGHGQDPQWRDLKDHLHEKHGYAVEAYEIGSRAGHTIRDILEDMLEASSFALLVMTGEDAAADGTPRARQNVVHEAGLFQGRLGFSRAIILLEHGTEEFSNIHGLQQIRFSKGRIKESFGDVLAVLKREVG